MLPNDIEKLLARFYAGETTAEEEQTLKEYFARTDVPPALHADRDMFRQLTEEDLPEVPEGMEERLSAFIDRLEEELDGEVTVIATGGLAKKIVPYCRRKIILDDELLLKGLAIIYHKNRR